MEHLGQFSVSTMGETGSVFGQRQQFIFPNDDGGLTMPSNAARWRQQADKLGIFAQTPKKIALAKMMIALLGASVKHPMINFDHCAGRCSAIAQQYHCIYYRPC
ncbi:hypothetical protein [Pseudomonas putida]|uniref:hypothetical protein n=1 Tax=Pseudomonas putida TaxID=303 RepID=UPI0037350FCC